MPNKLVQPLVSGGREDGGAVLDASGHAHLRVPPVDDQDLVSVQREGRLHRCIVDLQGVLKQRDGTEVGGGGGGGGGEL